jgi:hypothetical protein
MVTAARAGMRAFNLAVGVHLEVVPAVFASGPRVRARPVSGRGAGRSVLMGDWLLAPAWYARPLSRLSRPPERAATQATRVTGAVRTSSGPGGGTDGRKAAGPGKQM